MQDRLKPINSVVRVGAGILMISSLTSCEQNANTPTFLPPQNPNPEIIPTPEKLDVEVVFESSDKPPHIELPEGAEERYIYESLSTGDKIFVIDYLDKDWLIYTTQNSYEIVVSEQGIPEINTDLPPLITEERPDELMFITTTEEGYAFNLETGDIEKVELVPPHGKI